MPHRSPAENRDYMRRYMRDYRAEHSHPNARRTHFSNTDLAEIVRLYASDRKSMESIGQRFGCSGGTILYWLRKLNVKSRPQGGTGFKITPKHRAQAARKGVLSQASIAAGEFVQPSLIKFPQRLQAQFDAIMQDIRIERGTGWHLANVSRMNP